MTVEELIAQLKQFNPKLTVAYDEMGYGLTDIEDAQLILDDPPFVLLT
jgi:hypothetical protein